MTTHPVEVLMREHRLIEQVLAALEQRLTTLEARPFPREFFERTLEFFRAFADGCHHHKEEECLFPAMEARGVPRHGGPIGVMLHEHEIGRAHLRGIRENLEAAEGGSAAAVAAIRREATGYIELLRQHILKEDNILFRMARMVLPPEDVVRLDPEFQTGEEHDRWAEVAEELTRDAAPVGG